MVVSCLLSRWIQYRPTQKTPSPRLLSCEYVERCDGITLKWRKNHKVFYTYRDSTCFRSLINRIFVFADRPSATSRTPHNIFAARRVFRTCLVTIVFLLFGLLLIPSRLRASPQVFRYFLQTPLPPPGQFRPAKSRPPS